MIKFSYKTTEKNDCNLITEGVFVTAEKNGSLEEGLHEMIIRSKKYDGTWSSDIDVYDLAETAVLLAIYNPHKQEYKLTVGIENENGIREYKDVPLSDEEHKLLDSEPTLAKLSMELKYQKDVFQAYRNIKKAIDALESIGLLVEPDQDKPTVGNYLYGALDNLLRYCESMSFPEDGNALFEVDDGNGERFYLCFPTQIDNRTEWLQITTNTGVTLSCTPVEQITEGFSYHLIMHPGTEEQWHLFLPVSFDGKTDDAIYEWVTEYFRTTNYIIV